MMLKDNRKVVKREHEVVEDMECITYTLENGNTVVIGNSAVGLSDIEVVNIVDYDKDEIVIEWEHKGKVNSVVAKAEEIGGVFLPSVLLKIATVRMVKLIVSEMEKELLEIGKLEEYIKLEVGLLLSDK